MLAVVAVRNRINGRSLSTYIFVFGFVLGLALVPSLCFALCFGSARGLNVVRDGYVRVGVDRHE
jgi:hypothetical protein